MENELPDNQSAEIMDSSDELYERFQFTIDKGQEPYRIDKFLMNRIEGATRNKLQQAINSGMVLVNGKEVKQNYKIRPFDNIIVYSDMSPESTDVVPEKMDLNIVFEDEDLMVIAKPAGLVVHPTGNHPAGTLANGVVAYWQKRGEKRRFRAVNRLDKDTSGLLIVAKNQWAHEQFSRMQQERRLTRIYQAIAEGIVIPDAGVLDHPIGLAENSFITRQVQEDGQTAVTHFRVLARGDGMSHVELRLETGRTHQIRVHMSHEGHPLAGDDLYGGARTYIGRQALHAAELAFLHPRTGMEMKWSEPLPADMQHLLKRFFA